VKNSNKKGFAKQTDLHVSIILTARGESKPERPGSRNHETL